MNAGKQDHDGIDDGLYHEGSSNGIHEDKYGFEGRSSSSGTAILLVAAAKKVKSSRNSELRLLLQ